MVILSKKTIMDIGKGAMLSVKFSYRFSCAHPYITGMLFFVLILYRAFPSLFVFLVSSSPVIFCTAVLLGTLLSYGAANVPEVEEDDEKNPKILSLQVGGIVDDFVEKKNESFTLEAHVETYTEVNERAVEQAVLGEASNSTSAEILKNLPSEMVREDGNDDNDTASAAAFLLQEERKEIHSSMEAPDEREIHDRGLVKKEEYFEEKLAEHAEELDAEVPSVSNDKKVEGLVQVVQTTADSPFYSSLGSPWQPVDNDDVSCGSDSDDAESSSPDASMADILPMLDELHPLLESEYSESIMRATDNSDVSSSRSSEDHKSDDDDDDDDDGDDDDDDGIPKDDADFKVTEGESLGNDEVAVTWTADDQKNVMDLGISELERNQRLENLIAKRRLRKLQRLQTEKNLIDLDVYYPTSIPSISAPKPNPFDLPYDSDGNLNFHPVPGSAPSVLQPRGNPFDLPYDHDEIGTPSLEFLRKPDISLVFTGHVGSNMGPSLSNDLNQVKSGSKFRTSCLAGTTDLEEIELSPLRRELSQKDVLDACSDFEFDMVSSFTGQKHHVEPTQQEINHETVMSSTISTDVERAEQESQSFKEVDLVDNQHEQHGPHLASNHALGSDCSCVTEVIGEADRLPVIYTGELEVIEKIYEDSNLSSSQENDKSPVNTHEEFASLKLQSKRVNYPQATGESSLSQTDQRKFSESEVGSSLLSFSENPEMTVYNSQLHVLEACSFEELDSVFKQLHSEDIVTPVSGLTVENAAAPRSEIGTGELAIANTNKELTGTDSELLVLEANSVEDIDFALKQLNEKFVDDVSVSKSGISKIEPSELQLEKAHWKTWDVDSELHVIEAKTFEDIKFFSNLTLPEVLNYENEHFNAESGGRNLGLEVLEVKSSVASEKHIEAIEKLFEAEVLDALSSKATEKHIENEILDVCSEASGKHIEPEASEINIEPEAPAGQLPLEETEKQSEHEVLEVQPEAVSSESSDKDVEPELEIQFSVLEVLSEASDKHVEPVSSESSDKDIEPKLEVQYSVREVLPEVSEEHIEPEVSEKHIEPVSPESSEKHFDPELEMQSSEEFKFYSEEAATTRTTSIDEQTFETLGEDAARADVSRKAREGKSDGSSSNSSSSSSDSSDSE